MPSLSPVRTLVAVGPLFALLVACGGHTPPAEDATDHPAVTDLQGKGTPTGSGDTSATPASSPAASATPAAAAKPADTSGDLKVNTTDDPWMVAHQMPSSDVMKTLKSANAKVQGCWKEGLARDPSTSGEVKIRLVISNDGKVRAWRDDGSSMSDEDVTKCVGGVIEQLKFPKQKSPGDAWGIYSVHFGG